MKLKILKSGFRTKFVIKFGKTIKFKKFLCFIVVPYTAIKYIFLKLNSTKEKEYKSKFAICAIFKDEGKYLKEWIEYHRFIGVDKFYLYNNNSKDNYYEVLKPYIELNIVELKNYPGKQKQFDCYNDCLIDHKFDSKYIAFIDIDEFIFDYDKKGIEKIENTFSKYPNASSIQINWMIFGSNNQEKYKDDLVVKRFIKRSKIDFDMNKHTKSIVNPRKTLCFINPHYPLTIGKYSSINLYGDVLNNHLNSKFDENDVRINHYFDKSKEEYILKRQRGTADGNPIRAMELFSYHDKNDIYDDSMKLFYNNSEVKEIFNNGEDSR